ncbi:hypothetical protein L596_016632 [Steinernema carpocapsae]|uniref:Uncharacterized protein n=1 Tax=Steinernema carpocapsae TaxID=34508 RepID=A0A4V6XWA0_STECR|nr:hypothetical protein L596_016632 [Steinernema carpocapsae]
MESDDEDLLLESPLEEEAEEIYGGSFGRDLDNPMKRKQRPEHKDDDSSPTAPKYHADAGSKRRKPKKKVRFYDAVESFAAKESPPRAAGPSEASFNLTTEEFHARCKELARNVFGFEISEPRAKTRTWRPFEERRRFQKNRKPEHRGDRREDSKDDAGRGRGRGRGWGSRGSRGRGRGRSNEARSNGTDQSSTW